MFKEVEAGGIKTLVVDVRNNRGGNSMLCKQLLSWLKPIKEINKSKVQIRFSKLWEQQYPLLSEKYKNILSNKGDDYELGRLFIRKKRLFSISKKRKYLHCKYG